MVLLRFSHLVVSMWHTGGAGPGALRLSPTSGLLNAALIFGSIFDTFPKQMPPWLPLCSMNSVLSSRSWLA